MRKFKFAVFLIVLLVGSSCSSVTPSEKIDFPKTDIVYQAITFNAPADVLNNVIGFVNADGSGNVLLKINYRAHQPVFSRAQNGIFFIETQNPVDITPSTGYISFLDSAGEHKRCGGSIISLSKIQSYYGFTFPLNKRKELLASDSSNIQLFSIDDCNVTKTLVQYSDPVQNFVVGYAFPSNAGDQVIYDVYDNSLHSSVIKIIDLNTGQIKDILQGGRNASFSPDDKDIAYLGSNGIYIADVNGSNRRLLVPLFSDSGALPAPFWSPDGKSLVYHACIHQVCTEELSDYSIYKVDVQSGKVSKIVDKGLFPVWIK